MCFWSNLSFIMSYSSVFVTSRYLYKPSFVFLDTQAVCIPIFFRHSVDTCCPRNVSYWSERISPPFFSTVHVPKSFFAMMFLAQ